MKDLTAAGSAALKGAVGAGFAVHSHCRSCGWRAGRGVTVRGIKCTSCGGRLTLERDSLCSVGLFLFREQLLDEDDPATEIEDGGLEEFARAGGERLVVKLLDGTRHFEPDSTKRLVARGRELGLEVEGWGYHYCRSVAEAEREADKVVAVCRALGIRRYKWDGEEEWAHSPAVPRVTAQAFVRRVHLASGGEIEVWWTSYTAATFDGEPAMDDPHTAAKWDTLREFDGYAPQCYGTTRWPGRSDPNIRRVHIDRIRKGLDAGLSIDRICPLVSTGDVDKNGQHWTPWEGQDGVLAVARDLQLMRVDIWWGTNSKGRMTTRGRYAPALRELIPLLASRRVA